MFFSRNKTPAHYAAKAGNLKTLKLLIEKGALVSNVINIGYLYREPIQSPF